MNPTIDSIRRQYQAVVDHCDRRIAYAETNRAVLPSEIAGWKAVRAKAAEFVAKIEETRAA